MSCKEISADWAAQRIQGLSLAAAVKNGLLPKRRGRDRSKLVKTLIDSFRYPRLGPGMMWEAAAAKTKERGGRILMGRELTGLAYDDARKLWRISCLFEEDQAISGQYLQELYFFVRSSTVSDRL